MVTAAALTIVIIIAMMSSQTIITNLDHREPWEAHQSDPEQPETRLNDQEGPCRTLHGTHRPR